MAKFTGTDASELFSPTELSRSVTADPVDALPGDEGDDYEPGAGDDTVRAGAGGDWISEGFGADSGSDLLDGGDGSDYINGGAGADQLLGGAGNDRLDGGAGEDELRGGEGDDTLDGGADADDLDGGVGADQLIGGDGDDELRGGDGNDYLRGDGGYDVMLGGAGRDTIAISSFDSDVVGEGGRDYVDGGPGSDTLSFWETGTVDLRAGTAVLGGATWQFLSIENVDSGGGDSTVYGNERGNRIHVGENSIAWGFGGNDTLTTFGGTLRGGKGDDRLSGSGDLFGDAGNDRLTGARGGDLLFGGDGNDRIRGDDSGAAGGRDVLFGGAGQDVLIGGAAADTLYGGAGRDRFVFEDVRESTPLRPDIIRGGAPEGGSSAGSIEAAFEGAGRARGDRIDLRGIDARESSFFTDQAFRFDKRTEGGLWLVDDGDVTVVRGNVDDDRAAEFMVRIEDGADIHADDYTAADFLL